MTHDNQRRLEAWRKKYFIATGIMPTRIAHEVVHCTICRKVLWVPADQHRLYHTCSLSCDMQYDELIKDYLRS